MAIRRDQQQPAVLSPHHVAILLGGWGATPASGDDGGFRDGLFDLYVENLPGVARRWVEHEAFLRAEAARLGIEPECECHWAPSDRRYFFGEYAILELAHYQRVRAQQRHTTET